VVFSACSAQVRVQHERPLLEILRMLCWATVETKLVYLTVLVCANLCISVCTPLCMHVYMHVSTRACVFVASICIRVRCCLDVRVYYFIPRRTAVCVFSTIVTYSCGVQCVFSTSACSAREATLGNPYLPIVEPPSRLNVEGISWNNRWLARPKDALLGYR
jgi:hypothetical protein